MEQLKEGDKIRIISKDGEACSTRVLHGDKDLYYVTGVKIDITPGAHIKADLEMISLVLDIEATVGEIIDSNPKLNEVKKIVDAGIDRNGSLDEFYNDVVRVFYPKG